MGRSTSERMPAGIPDQPRSFGNAFLAAIRLAQRLCSERCVQRKMSAHTLVLLLVPGGGVEPPRPQGSADFESAASASSAIPACCNIPTLQRPQFALGDRRSVDPRTHPVSRSSTDPEAAINGSVRRKEQKAASVSHTRSAVATERSAVRSSSGRHAGDAGATKKIPHAVRGGKSLRPGKLAHLCPACRV